MLEVDTCRERLSKYCVGTGVDIGFGGSPIVPWAICIDQDVHSCGRAANFGEWPTHIVGDASKLIWFSDCSLDWVFSSHCLEDFQDTESVLREWVRVLKVGGHLVLFLPDQEVYVRHCKAHGTIPNQAHKHFNFSLSFVKTLLGRAGKTEVVYSLWPVPNNAYSFDLVAKKIA